MRWVLLFCAGMAAGAIAALGVVKWGMAERKPEIASTPTAFDRAVAFVREEAEGATNIKAPDHPRFRLYAALSAMSYIQANISSARYSLEQRTRRAEFVIPAGTDVCLARGIGICGNHIQAFLDIMDQLDVPARPVQVYFVDAKGGRQSHIVAEVEWRGRWHMFDVTWGFVAIGADGEPLSYMEVRNGTPYRPRINANSPWTVVAGEAFDVLEYLTAEADIVIDRNGTVRPYVVKRSAWRIEYGLLHIPDIVGVYEMSDGDEERIAFELDLPEGFDTVTIVPKSVICPQGGGVTVGGTTVAVGAEPIRFNGLQSKVRIEADSAVAGITCYVQVKEIYAERSNQS